MTIEVKVRNRDAVTVLSRRVTVRLSGVGSAISTAMGEIYGHLERLGVRATGEPFVLYHGMPGPNDSPFDVEVCAPVPRPVDPPPDWRLAELPSGVFASLLHEGPYSTLGQTYDRLGAWIPENGYAIAGPPREVYLSEPSTPPELTRTVVEFPVTRIPAATPAG